jgi:ABC-type transport system involved in multi-copper enzyme maturation permease subunit
MSALRVSVVARLVCRELLGLRLLYAVGAYAVVLFLLSRIAGPLSAGEDVKVVKDFGLAAMELGGALVVIMVGAGFVAGESDRRTLPALLAKPLHRWELVAGHYLGVACAAVAGVLATSVALCLVLATMGDRPPTDGIVPALDPGIAVAVLLIGAELALVAAVAVFFSVMASSSILAVLFSLGVFVTGQLSGDLRAFGSAVEMSPLVERAVELTGWLVPAFSAFDVKTQVVHGVRLPRPFVALTCGYAALYATALVAGAAALFSRRELS